MSMRFDQSSAISMYSMIANHVNQSDSLVFNLQSGLAICLSPDCKVKSNNNEINTTSTTTEKSDDQNSVSLIVAPAVGVLCGVIIILLVIVITLVWVMKKRYAKGLAFMRLCTYSFVYLLIYSQSRKSIRSKHSNIKVSTNEDPDHVYDELSTFTMKHLDLPNVNKTPSPKSDKVIFDTKKIETPGYQPLPVPRYESCSAISIAKSNHSNDYYIEEDARSIKDTDCQLMMEMNSKEHEEVSKEDEPYCKLYHPK